MWWCFYDCIDVTGRKKSGSEKEFVKCRFLVQYESVPSILLVSVINKNNSDKRFLTFLKR